MIVNFGGLASIVLAFAHSINANTCEIVSSDGAACFTYASNDVKNSPLVTNLDAYTDYDFVCRVPNGQCIEGDWYAIILSVPKQLTENRLLYSGWDRAYISPGVQCYVWEVTTDDNCSPCKWALAT